MSGDALLDTNAVIGFINGNASAVAAVTSMRAFLPAIAAGELYYGAFKSAHTASNVAAIQRFFPTVTLVACDVVTAEHYGRIKTDLRAKGRPIPNNDLWIAAIAMQHGLDLLSRDAHFDHVAGLTRIAW